MSDMKAIENRKILKVKTDGTPAETVDDAIAVESQLSVVLNGTSYVTLLCTPEKLEDLVLGHLLSEGIINNPSQLNRIQFTQTQRCEVDVTPEPDLQKRIEAVDSRNPAVFKGNRRMLSPSAESGSDLAPLMASSDVTFPLSALQRAIDTLNRDASIYRKTGGVHAACIASKDGETVCLAEDVGRYNAVDKAIGGCARRGCSFQDKFLATTGRITGVMILKVARVNIPVVASISAVISSGVEVAERIGVTTVGFVRRGRMNIYTHPKRICI
jgi:FdhD protein